MTYRKVFPKCPVRSESQGRDCIIDQSFLPSLIPNKCEKCTMFFGGGCTGSSTQYMDLDFGPCGKKGKCHPVQIDNAFVLSKVFVPQKCVSCVHLKFSLIAGFTCYENVDPSLWKGKTLDWDLWYPEFPNIQYRDCFLSQSLFEAISKKKEVLAIKLFRSINPGTSIKDGRDAYAFLHRYFLSDESDSED